MDAYKVPGAAIAVIKNYEIDEILKFGMADKENSIPIKEDTIFCACSISKSLTAWGVMRLVEMGIIDLDTPVETYLTKWHFPSSEFDVNKVTLRRLLSHTAGTSIAGLPGRLPDLPYESTEEFLNNTDWKPDELQLTYRKSYAEGDYDTKVELIHEPGTKWEYSGGGFTVIQLVIEEVTGMRFPEFIKKEIFSPLGLVNSFYDYTKEEEETKLSHSARYDAEGNTYPLYKHVMYAAGGWNTTIKDLARFTIASLKKELLSERSFEEMWTPIIFESKEQLFDLYHGLGHSIVTAGPIKVVLHSGGHPGTRTFFLAIPAIGEGLCFFFNSNNANPIQDQILLMWAKYLGMVP
jgi:CubicO group peptidase (beta-lactamase class C family)